MRRLPWQLPAMQPANPYTGAFGSAFLETRFEFTDAWPENWDGKRNRYGAYGEDRIRELVKAGALIAAEIDRLRRL